jgi:hypothetical protein
MAKKLKNPSLGGAKSVVEMDALIERYGFQPCLFPTKPK